MSTNRNPFSWKTILVGGVTLASLGLSGHAIAQDEEESDSAVLETIIVTGTRMSNVAPASPVVVLSREEIDARGLSSVEDVLRYVPQNFSTITSGGLADGQGVRFVAGATTVNLRGLGEGTTLVLVDGKRIAASPTESGTFTDISTIPFGAIERIEILTDGASAIYGSDAVGGVMNFILKKDYSGAETRVRYEGSSSDGNGLTINQNLGFGWGSGNLTANVSVSQEDPVNRYEAGLSDERDFTAQGGRSFPSRYTQTGQPPTRDPLLSLDLTPDTEQTSAYLNLRQDIGDSVVLNLGGLFSERESVSRSVADIFFNFVPDTNFYNNTGSAQLARYAFFEEVDSGNMLPVTSTSNSERLSFNGSIDWTLPVRDWVLTAGFTVSEDEISGGRWAIDSRGSEVAAALASGDPATALNVFGDGTVQRGNLNDLRTFVDNGSRTGEQETFSVTLNGTAGTIAAGDVMFSVGAEVRDDTLDLVDYRLNPIGRSDPSLVSFKPQTENQAVYVELFVPIMERLSVQLAGRYDNYDLTGPFDGFDSSFTILPFTSRSWSDFVPKIGVKWVVSDSVKLRATWGEAFQVPTMPELFEPQLVDESFPSTWFDPRNPASNGGPGDVDVPSVFGGNPELQPQESETYTLGFDFTPASIRDLDVSVSYINTEFNDKIGGLLDAFGFSNIFGTNAFPLVNSELFPVAVRRDAAGVLTYFDAFGVFNLASQTSENLDLSIRKGFDLGSGNYEFGLFAVHTLDSETIVAPGVPAVENTGTDSSPPDWNVRAYVDWFRNDWRASAVVNYTDSYRNTDEDANVTTVDSYTTVDVNVGYDLAESGWRLNLGINNLFDEDFPFVDSRNGVDSSRVNFRRRVAYLEVSKEFSF